MHGFPLAPKRCCKRAYDVFINHQRIDTGRTFVPLFYDHLMNTGIRPFWDSVHKVWSQTVLSHRQGHKQLQGWCRCPLTQLLRLVFL